VRPAAAPYIAGMNKQLSIALLILTMTTGGCSMMPPVQSGLATAAMPAHIGWGNSTSQWDFGMSNGATIALLAGVVVGLPLLIALLAR
jgi:hypothetical protein